MFFRIFVMKFCLFFIKLFRFIINFLKKCKFSVEVEDILQIWPKCNQRYSMNRMEY